MLTTKSVSRFFAGAILISICSLALTASASDGTVGVVSTASSAAEPDTTPYRPPEHNPSALLRRSVYDAGRWSLGVDGSFSMTSSRIDLLDGDVATDSTFFLRVDPQVSVAILSRFEVGLITGLVSRRLAREGGDSSTETAFALQPLARYHLPATPRLAVYGQAAPGYYMGRSTRFVDIDGTEVDEQTSTRGFVLTIGTGVNYRLSNGLQLRFGLSFNGLWGRERIEAIGERLSTSTVNFGTAAGLRYTF